MTDEDKKALSALIRLTEKTKNPTVYFSIGIIRHGMSTKKCIYARDIHAFLAPYVQKGIVYKVYIVIPNGKPRAAYRANLEQMAELTQNWKESS